MNGSEVSLVREYPRAWAEVDPDILGMIFNRLSLEEKLKVIPRVCKPWRHAAEGPYSWEKMEKIDIDGLIKIHKHKKLDSMLRMLVTTSSAESSSSIDHPGFGNGKGNRDWAEMIPDALGLIFNMLSFEEKLQVIPRVCKPWRETADGSNYSWNDLWMRRIDIYEWMGYRERIEIDRWITRDNKKKQFQIQINEESKQLRLTLLRVLVTTNSGCFNELHVPRIGDSQLSFIAHHARSLRVLSVKSSSITDSMVEQVAPKLSSLTAIDLSQCKAITARSLAAIGTNCGSLESLTWDVCTNWCPSVDASLYNDIGRAIVRTMPKLKRLSIAYVNIGAEVAHQILSGCPALEWFNIRGCRRLCREARMLEDEYPKIQVIRV